MFYFCLITFLYRWDVVDLREDVSLVSAMWTGIMFSYDFSGHLSRTVTNLLPKSPTIFYQSISKWSCTIKKWNYYMHLHKKNIRECDPTQKFLLMISYHVLKIKYLILYGIYSGCKHQKKRWKYFIVYSCNILILLIG